MHTEPNPNPKKAGLLDRLLRNPRIEEALREADREEREAVAAGRAALIAERAAALEELAAAARQANAEVSAAEEVAHRARAALADAERALQRAHFAKEATRVPILNRISALERRLFHSAPPSLAVFDAWLTDEHQRLRNITPSVCRLFLGYQYGDHGVKKVYDEATNAESIEAALRAVMAAHRAIEPARLSCASDEEAEQLIEELRAGIPEVESPTLAGDEAAA